jgi:hypothetical protein
VPSHAWGVVPLHSVCPGAHTPVQVPPMHVELEQVGPVVQLPLALHDCGAFPAHWVWPGDNSGSHGPSHDGGASCFVGRARGSLRLRA